MTDQPSRKPTEIHKRGEIPVNTPTCEKCGKMFLECHCPQADHPGTKFEEYAKLFHETYERLAPTFGYETRKASAVPWERVPENNRTLMIAVCTEVLNAALAAKDAEIFDAPVLSHQGACGPEAGCDAGCMEVASYADFVANFHGALARHDREIRRAALEEAEAGNYLNTERKVRAGIEVWAGKPHNRKWLKKIEGTPILNDLTVNITAALTDAEAPSGQPKERMTK